MKEIQLSQGKVAIVDDEDFELLSMHKWYAWRSGHAFYARRNVRRPDGGKMLEYMHRVILALKLDRALTPSYDTDHENGDGLDNRRGNLRAATRAQNSRNRHRQKSNKSSRFLGVSWNKEHKRWRAQIGANGIVLCLGRFDTELAAVEAREAFIAAHPELMARSNRDLLVERAPAR